MEDPLGRKERQICRSQVTDAAKVSVGWLIDRTLARPPTVHEISPLPSVSRAFVAKLSLGPVKFTFVHFGWNEIPISAWCFWLAVE
jgi:hypothetical protein